MNISYIGVCLFFLDKKILKVFLFIGMISVDIIFIFLMLNIYCKVCYWVIFNKLYVFNVKNKKLFFVKYLYYKI